MVPEQVVKDSKDNSEDTTGRILMVRSEGQGSGAGPLVLTTWIALQRPVCGRVICSVILNTPWDLLPKNPRLTTHHPPFPPTLPVGFPFQTLLLPPKI